MVSGSDDTESIIDVVPMLELTIAVSLPNDLGVVDGVHRRFVPIVGGRVSGELNGTILAGGGDWQSIAPDGTLDLAARYVAAIAEARVEIDSRGIRAGPAEVLARLAAGDDVPANEYYFRTMMRFRTGAPTLLYLNRMLAVGIGERHRDAVHIKVHRIR